MSFKDFGSNLFVNTSESFWWKGPRGPITGSFSNWTGSLTGFIAASGSLLSGDFSEWTIDSTGQVHKDLMFFIDSVSASNESIVTLNTPNLSKDHRILTFNDLDLTFYYHGVKTSEENIPSTIDIPNKPGYQWKKVQGSPGSKIYQATKSLAPRERLVLDHPVDDSYARIITVFFDGKTTTKAAIYLKDKQTVIINCSMQTVTAILNVLI